MWGHPSTQHMVCSGCEEEAGEPVEVEYNDGGTEVLPLCDRCREDFQDGNFIDGVTLVETG